MIVKSARLGEREVPDDQVIWFPDGVLGFEELKRYVLLAPEGPDGTVWVLQAVDEPAVSFIVVDPRFLRPGYVPKLQEADRAALGISGDTPPESLTCLAILTVYEDPGKMTANLLAPIVIRKSPLIGRQVVQVDSGYSVREPLFPGGTPGQAGGAPAGGAKKGAPAGRAAKAGEPAKKEGNSRAERVVS